MCSLFSLPQAGKHQGLYSLVCDTIKDPLARQNEAQSASGNPFNRLRIVTVFKLTLQNRVFQSQFGHGLFQGRHALSGAFYLPVKADQVERRVNDQCQYR